MLDVELPPLRERPGDARLLGEHFLGVCAERQMEVRKRFHLRTLDWLDHYEWPGNVRELENFVQRESLLAEGPEIVFPRIAQPVVVPAGPDDPGTLQYRAAREAVLEEFRHRSTTRRIPRRRPSR